MAIISPIFTTGKSENLSTVKKQPKLEENKEATDATNDGYDVESEKITNQITYDVEDPDFGAGDDTNNRKQLMVDGLSFIWFHLAMIFFSFYIGKQNTK